MFTNQEAYRESATGSFAFHSVIEVSERYKVK